MLSVKGCSDSTFAMEAAFAGRFAAHMEGVATAVGEISSATCRFACAKPMWCPSTKKRMDAAIAAACPPGVMLIDTGAAVARQALRVAPATSAAPDGPAVAYVTGGVANQAAMAPAFARFGYDEVRVVDV